MKKILTCLFALMLFFATNTVVFAETVAFNTKTLKIHKLYCQWAQKCTVNCIQIEKKEAVKRGGVPCKVCGG